MWRTIMVSQTVQCTSLWFLERRDGSIPVQFLSSKSPSSPVNPCDDFKGRIPSGGWNRERQPYRITLFRPASSSNPFGIITGSELPIFLIRPLRTLDIVQLILPTNYIRTAAHRAAASLREYKTRKT